MPATIHYGKRFAPIHGDNGRVIDIEPREGGYEFVGRERLTNTIEECERLGINSNLWPVYDVGEASQVPLQEALDKCEKLRNKFQELSEDNMQNDDCLVIFQRIFERGQLFFVVM